MIRLAVPSLFTIALLSSCVAAGDQMVFARTPLPDSPRLQGRQITEASGLTSSIRRDGFLWLVNDSGAGPILHLAGLDGSDRGSIRVEGATNTDWEALAGFSWKGAAYLLIADIGDNNARRDHLTLYLLPEPELPADGAVVSGSIKPQRTIRFRYPDGPRDGESVAVDAAAGKIILISKRTNPPEVYQLPLDPRADGILTAERIGTTDVRPPPGGLPHPFGSQPTDLAISPDHSLAAVLTYVTVFLFARDPGETWAEAFARKPVALDRHRLVQAEAIAFSRDGNSLFVVSEGVGSPIVRYDRRAADPSR